MSLKKGGFSTLNRWLGIKNKDKNTPNGKLSKSSTNLSVSTTDMSEPSQLEYNRITPVPAATSNAPFEQTFRITVLLPKDQLYVARLGARVSLNKLLELVCEHKQLDAEKYEFRNPVDPSQIYSTELTIGAVGLSEIRLCHKSESYDNFNADEVIKLHRTSVIRDSLSSSEFSRHSKHTTKTASPYSSSNSLNSMDSTGVNYTRTPISPPPPALPNSTPPKLMAPPRKKRAAPRPPSQVVIPEKSALVLDLSSVQNGNGVVAHQTPTPVTPEARNAMPRCYVSTPNLSLPATQSPNIDCNGNSNAAPLTNYNGVEMNGHQGDHMDMVDAQVDQKNARNLYSGSVQNLSSPTAMGVQKFPEPSPRKRLLNIKKKSAPAPPPGGTMNGSMYSEDSISLNSNFSAPGTPQTPTTEHRSIAPPTPTPTQPSPICTTKTTTTTTASTAISVTKLNSPEPDAQIKPLPRVDQSQTTSPPKPVPRLTTTTLLNSSNATVAAAPSSNVPAESVNSSSAPSTPPASGNVSKVLLNRTPTPEPRSLSTEPPMDFVDSSLSNTHDTQLTAEELTRHDDNDDNVSKQADSGIGEPVPSPLPDSLPSEGSTHECKSTFESSSDDDDMIKVYNFKLGKTVVQPLRDANTLEDLTAIAAHSDSGEHTPANGGAATPVAGSETTSWNFAIPISPPPNFADTQKTTPSEEQSSDAPITPKILERPVLNFEAITAESASNSSSRKTVVAGNGEGHLKPATLQQVDYVRETSTTPLPSPTGPLNEILDELNTIISEKRMDTLIRPADERPEIEAAKPNTLANFSITTITQQQQTTKPLDTPSACSIGDGDVAVAAVSVSAAPNDISALASNQAITRADSSNDTANNAPALAAVASTTTTTTTTTMQIQQVNATILTSPNDLNNGNGMTSRSSSYLSLTKIEPIGLSLSRRRSSGELSIGESPSPLQSPEVVKTILNSRKNSLANSSDGESRVAIAEVINRLEAHNDEEHSAAKMLRKPATTAAATQDFIAHEKQREEREKQQEQPAAKELPKVYRYSGPPSINFSTWSERPKVQVAIKNEGDYIFGGKNASTANAAVTTATIEINNTTSTTTTTNTNSMPRNYRASTPAEAFWAEHTKLKQAPPAVPPKPESTTIQRMGIPEKEYHVPVVVKPLKDEVVENVSVVAPAKKPPLEASRTKTSITTVTLNGSGGIGGGGGEHTSSSSSTSTETTSSTVVRRTVTQGVYSNATLPRASGANTNRYSMPAPIVTLRTTSTAATVHAASAAPANKPKATTATTTAEAVPFGQNTLRKTGLKEKILAKEEAEQQAAKSGVSSVTLNGSSSSSNSHAPAAANFNRPPAHEPAAVAKTVVTINASPTAAAAHSTAPKPTITIKTTATAAKPFVPAKTPTPPTTLQSAKLEMKFQSQPATAAAAKEVNMNGSTISFSKPMTVTKTTIATAPSPAAAPPPPPPPAPAMSVTVKKTTSRSKSVGTTPTSPLDTRDELLAAIRNFKREELHRV